MLNFGFLEKGLGINFPPPVTYYFSRKMFLILYSIKVACLVDIKLLFYGLILLLFDNTN